MDILCLVKRTPRDLLCFDTSYMTFAELKASIDINERYDLVFNRFDYKPWYEQSPTITPEWQEPGDLSTAFWFDANRQDLISATNNEVNEFASAGPDGTVLVKHPSYPAPTSGLVRRNGLNMLNHQPGLLWAEDIALPASGNLTIAMAVDFAYPHTGGIISMNAGSDWMLLPDGSVFNGRLQRSGNPDVNLSGGPFLGTQIIVIDFNYTNDLISVYMNGILRGQGPYGTMLDTIQDLALGANKGPIYPGSFKFGEKIIMYDMDPSLRVELEGYLAWRWLMVDGLDPSHPFKGSYEEDIATINLSALMFERPDIAMAEDWVDLESRLTNAMVDIYSVSPMIPAQMFTIDEGKVKLIEPPTTTGEDIVGPKIVSTTHQQNIGMDYGNLLDPTFRNHPFLTHRATEVIFKHLDNEPVVDFEQCLPVINGVVHYPVVHENELYAVNGTQPIKAAYEPNVGTLLIDFTPLGGMETVRFKDCTVLDTEHGYGFKLPDGKTFKDKQFVLVLAGRLIMSVECHQLGDDSFAIAPSHINLDNIRLSNRIINGYYISGTQTVRQRQTEEEYMLSLTDENHYESFIVIIDNPSIEFYMLNHVSTINPRMLKFPKQIGGLLMRKMTRELIDYNREFDTDGSIVRLAPTKRCCRLIVDREDNQMEVAYSGQTPELFNHAICSEDNGYVMIDVMTKEA